MAQNQPEKEMLTKFASLDGNREEIRECITKIMNTLSFRKLAGKTQVILSLTGPDVRTRLTHTIEVANIAKDICRDLGLNEELADAMALAHDIGHTPFGHVGERTLQKIMCGCDTLGNKVRDDDFGNSGFKHNLQSFRVLIDLERIDKNSNGEDKYATWPYIVWGALAHTKQTYAKSYSGMDDEIFISSKHCDWVYVCYYHDKKECKRNIQKKKAKEKEDKNIEICKPWYCARIPVIKDRNEVKQNDLNHNDSRREYIKKEPIKKEYLKWIYCSHKCYLAKLWEYKKNTDNKSIYKTHPYLYDHPFPNSFYAKSLNNYFSSSIKEKNLDFVSFESQIVGQADEIAQRQQDLEDGINKGLLSFEKSSEAVEKLIKKITPCSQKMLSRLNNIDNSKDLGELLACFYKKALVKQTKKNVSHFVTDDKKVEINIYNLMNILYAMNDDKDKEKWILKEFESLEESSKSGNPVKCLEDYFEISFDSVYLFLLSYDYLEKCTKRADFIEEDTINIMSKCVDSLYVKYCEQVKEKTEELCESGEKDLFKLKEALKKNNKDRFESAYEFIRTLDLLRDYLRKNYEEGDDFFKNEKKKWKTIGWLNLRPFYSLYQIFTGNFQNNNGSIITISDLKVFKTPANYNPKMHEKETFKNWKEVLKSDANKVLANLVSFTDDDNDDHDSRKKALKDFKKSQCDTIIKSEPVEKNDGKASYILRRLFKAYITNSHQLPDLGLRYILISLTGKNKLENLWESEKKALKEILDKLKKTMPNNSKTNDDLKKIWTTDLLKFGATDTEFEKLEDGKSNEIKAVLKKRRDLAIYFVKLGGDMENIKLNSEKEKEKDKDFIKEQLRKLRAILDNSILNKTLYWESILTRGICDYIASLTDQEAVNEYEKLYAGIMELV